MGMNNGFLKFFFHLSSSRVLLKIHFKREWVFKGKCQTLTIEPLCALWRLFITQVPCPNWGWYVACGLLTKPCALQDGTQWENGVLFSNSHKGPCGLVVSGGTLVCTMAKVVKTACKWDSYKAGNRLRWRLRCNDMARTLNPFSCSFFIFLSESPLKLHWWVVRGADWGNGGPIHNRSNSVWNI